MPKGTIKRLMDRGFGFIKTEEQEGDLFFHRNDIEDVEFASLREGQEVEFEMNKGPDGRFAAVKVRLAETKSKGSGEGTGGDSGSDSGGDGGADM
ncbi:cold-shock protein [Chloroflexota bacterium]